MKSMLKSELAERAGVSVTTLMNWCKPYHQELVNFEHEFLESHE